MDGFKLFFCNLHIFDVIVCWIVGENRILHSLGARFHNLASRGFAAEGLATDLAARAHLSTEGSVAIYKKCKWDDEFLIFYNEMLKQSSVIILQSESKDSILKSVLLALAAGGVLLTGGEEVLVTLLLQEEGMDMGEHLKIYKMMTQNMKSVHISMIFSFFS